MKGVIESLRFPTDVKDQRYAIAVIGGEEIYSWDERILGYLRGLKPGAEIEYELMSRGGKFKKFKNITSGESGTEGEGPAGPPGGWDWDSIRILAITDMKNRTKALDMATIHTEDVAGAGEEKAEMTLKLAEKYLDFIQKDYKALFESINMFIDKEFKKK